MSSQGGLSVLRSSSPQIRDGPASPNRRGKSEASRAPRDAGRNYDRVESNSIRSSEVIAMHEQQVDGSVVRLTGTLFWKPPRCEHPRERRKLSRDRSPITAISYEKPAGSMRNAGSGEFGEHSRTRSRSARIMRKYAPT